MYHLSYSVICGVIAVAALGLFNPDTGSKAQVPSAQPTSIYDSVNRTAKSDRLQQTSESLTKAGKDDFNARIKDRTLNGNRPAPAQKMDETKSVPAEMPVGCEPAVSAVLDNMLAKIPSRCISSLPLAGNFA
jgi:hypothetical protein